MAKMNLYGAKEFEEKLEVCQKRAPARIITYLEKEGKQIRTAYRKKLKQEAKSNPKKKRNHLRDGLKVNDIDKKDNDYKNRLRMDYGISPHYHLVEYGHNVVRNEKIFGRVKGKYYFKRTILDMEKKIEKQRHKLTEKLYKELM